MKKLKLLIQTYSFCSVFRNQSILSFVLRGSEDSKRCFTCLNCSSFFFDVFVRVDISAQTSGAQLVSNSKYVLVEQAECLRGTHTNSVDSDETPRFVASLQWLCCLPK